jgi:hypothetical protein
MMAPSAGRAMGMDILCAYNVYPVCCLLFTIFLSHSSPMGTCYITVGTFARLGLGLSVMKLEKSEFEVGLRVLSSK